MIVFTTARSFKHILQNERIIDMYLVSACLLGENCKYSGGNNECRWVKDFLKDKDYLPVCPEALGGLPTPRPPAELINGRAIDKNGKDVTENFIIGAEKTLQEAKKKAEELGQTLELAILKANSPSCGSGRIYDGTFTGKRINGDGIFAELLKKHDIPVITEEDEIKIKG